MTPKKKKKLLEVVSEFSKVAGYKMNIQKYVVFLYINNELSERDTKETIPFITASKRIKCLGINLPKESEYLYSKNHKTPMKILKMTQTDGKIYCVFGLEESTLIQ